jgi:hypothetical protein
MTMCYCCYSCWCLLLLLRLHANRIAHFTEVDALDALEPLALLQPAQPLVHGERYVVGVANLVGVDSRTLPPTPGFSALLQQLTATPATATTDVSACKAIVLLHVAHCFTGHARCKATCQQ